MNAAAQLLSKGEAIGLLLAFIFIAISTWTYQNRDEQRLGGKISPIKAAWLSYAIVLWIVLPIILWHIGFAFRWLAISMLVRAAIEIPLCLSGKWRVIYGISHDLFHTALLAAVVIFFPHTGLIVWAFLTGIALATEIVFVKWFVTSTGGPTKGIFFVPAGKSFRTINRRTALLFLPQAAAFITILSYRIIAP